MKRKMNIRCEKKKLNEAGTWRKELRYELQHAEKISMDEFCLKSRLYNVLDGYIAIQSRLVSTLENEKKGNGLMKEKLKDLKWWQNRCYRKIRRWFNNGSDN